MAQVHRFATALEWAGSTAAGYRDYPRAHRVAVPPTGVTLDVSADPAFRGDATLLNPEQLVLVAASSCQALSFLAVAARGGVDVVAYADRAEALMPVTRGPLRITTIVLRPRVTVRGDVDPDRLQRMTEQAHAECFVANSLDVEMVIEAEFAVG